MRVYNLLWQLKLDLRLRSQIWNLRDHRGTTGAEASLITGTEICSTIDGWVAVFGLCPFLLSLCTSCKL